jgi:anti-sigma B factor antagonist
MEIRKIITGECHELLVSGRIDGAGANALEVEVLATIRAGANPIYVNLAEATFLCSAGLRVLLQYYRQMKGKGKTFLATRPSPEVASAIEMTGFTDLVEK